MTIHTAPTDTPPPLPQPGSTPGREEMPPTPAPPPHGREREGCSSGLSLLGSPLSSWRGYVVGLLFLTAIWALSGGGSFWPAWAALGWGLCLLGKGRDAGVAQVPAQSSRPATPGTGSGT